MKKKETKSVIDAKYLHKYPEEVLNTGFASLERYSVINEYDDGSISKNYNCDIVVRRGIDAVGVIPYMYINNELHILLISNFRAAAFFREKILGEEPIEEISEHSKTMIEIPAGIIEEDELKLKKIETGIKRCSSRELLEETGYNVPVKNFTILGSFYYSSPGLLTERIYISTCNITGMIPEEIKGDGSIMEESIKTFTVPFTKALEWCKTGVIRNAVTEIGIHRLYFLLLSAKEEGHNKILQKRLQTMYNDIRSLKKEASYHNKLIREFRATITHELNHPLTEVMGYLSLLRNKNTSNEIKEKSIDIISRSISKLYEVNKNLVKVALQDDDSSHTVEEFDVYKTIEEIVESYKYVHDSNLEINISICENCNTLIGNHNRLRLILEGIISNAFKFTKTGSINVYVRLIDTIENKFIDLSPDLFNYHIMSNIVPHEIEILVKDTGIGIKPKQLKKIFIPFFQSDSRFSREFAGVGLGLYVVNDLVATMQGSITIDSVVGTGTIVKMRIPFGISQTKTN